jgi:hypothetical protein
VKDKDIPMGPFRWLTVNSPQGAQGVELVLEPMSFAPRRPIKKLCLTLAFPQPLSSPTIFRGSLRG